MKTQYVIFTSNGWLLLNNPVNYYVNSVLDNGTRFDTPELAHAAAAEMELSCYIVHTLYVRP